MDVQKERVRLSTFFHGPSGDYSMMRLVSFCLLILAASLFFGGIVGFFLQLEGFNSLLYTGLGVAGLSSGGKALQALKEFKT